ncbi:MAG: radical SAM protein [Bacteroidetes bacterium]|nr:radical SAM protein [Bacteroidota bacterium]
MLQQKQVTSVLNKQKKRDEWFLTEYSVNPYEGCSCNCLYCYIRGSKYGENMSEHLAIKANALEILEKQLRNKASKNQYGVVVVGSATDAYMHQEEKYELTRGFLKLLLKYRFPVFISTKKLLIKRDIDILKKIDATAILPSDLKDTLKRGTILSVSISSLDEKITDILEPGAAKPSERLQLLFELKKEGFLTGVNAIPLLPFISDSDAEMEKIIIAAKAHGAEYILIGGLTLFGTSSADSKTLYYKFLERYDRSLITKYDQLYGDGYFAAKKYQQDLKERADRLCKKHEIRNKILAI